jgi:predicted lipoprotein
MRRAALASIADNVIVPTYQEFAERTQRLLDATAALQNDPAERGDAQESWRAAMETWQRAELMQVGPAGAKEYDIAGAEDLRFEIYSWPLTNRCRVDQELVEAAYADPAAFKGEAGNVRGLDAMEYLLFRDDAENDCRTNSAINEDGTWEALGDSGITARRAAYAHTLAILLKERADELLGLWEDGFRDELALAGTGSATYLSTQAGLNEVSNALFYLDRETKDAKLARPLGLSDCDDPTCPDNLECGWSQTSAANVVGNIDAFTQVFTGATGLGFDDLLVEVGMESLATRMIDLLEEARQTCSDTGTYETELSKDPPNTAPAQSCYDALKQVTDLFKTQFLSVLDLEAPNRAEGDND